MSCTLLRSRQWSCRGCQPRHHNLSRPSLGASLRQQLQLHAAKQAAGISDLSSGSVPQTSNSNRQKSGNIGLLSDVKTEVLEELGSLEPSNDSISVAPDAILEAPEGGGSIYVFGCSHGDSDSPQMSRFILERRPCSVVVETAVNCQHGSATGNVLTREGALDNWRDFRCKSWAQMGIELEKELHQDSFSFSSSEYWADLALGPRRLWSEQLAYVASFAVGAEIVFGDRAKEVTYHRLLWCPTVQDMDAAFGMQSALNYHELVSTLRPFNDVENKNCVHQVLILERDATLLHSLHEASLRAGPDGCVVGVVGASHLAGMKHLWEEGRWRDVLDGGAALQMPDIEAVKAQSSKDELAVRWALFHAVLRLTCRVDVIYDVRAVLGPVPEEHRRVFSLVKELYGSSRMLLAVLNQEQLSEVIVGRDCDYYEVLAPLRAVRPVNGGPGFDEELVLALRNLDFILDESAVQQG